MVLFGIGKGIIDMSINCRPCERRSMVRAGLVPLGLVELSKLLEDVFLLMRKERTITAMRRYLTIEEMMAGYDRISPRYAAVVGRWLHAMHKLLRSRGFWDKAWFDANDMEHMYE